MLLHFTTNLRCKTTYQIHTHTHSIQRLERLVGGGKQNTKKKIKKNQKILELPQIQCRDGKTTRRASKNFRSFVKRSSSSSSSTSQVESREKQRPKRQAKNSSIRNPDKIQKVLSQMHRAQEIVVTLVGLKFLYCFSHLLPHQCILLFYFFDIRFQHHQNLLWFVAIFG